MDGFVSIVRFWASRAWYVNCQGAFRARDIDMRAPVSRSFSPVINPATRDNMCICHYVSLCVIMCHGIPLSYLKTEKSWPTILSIVQLQARQNRRSFQSVADEARGKQKRGHEKKAWNWLETYLLLVISTGNWLIMIEPSVIHMIFRFF